MGPYCKFCNTRCFIPTNKDDLVKADLKATCLEGVIFDMNKTYPKLVNQHGKQVGWLSELKRGEGHSLAVELFKDIPMEYEVSNNEIEEVLVMHGNVDRFYRLTK